MRFGVLRVFTLTVGSLPALWGRSGRRRGLVVALVALTLAAGCGGSGYSYLSNKDEQLYFKVPDDWTIFTTTDLSDAIGQAATARTWMRGFAAGKKATIENVFALASELPRGYAEVITLTPSERDTLNLASLRGANFGVDQTTGAPIDPLVYMQEHPDGQLQILGYDDSLVLGNGRHGVRIRVAISSQDHSATAVIDQIAMVDKATAKRYVLNIGCSAKCFDQNEKVIKEVIESWTLDAK